MKRLKLFTSLKFSLLALIVLTMLVLASCSISYTFSGASLSPDVKTVFVDVFPNRASLINPSLSQNFTEALKDKFTSEAGLSLQNNNADLEFSGDITGYSLSPVAIQQNEAAMMRLTITVQVKFVNNIDPKQNYSTSFSEFEDYSSDQDFNSVEAQLNETIIKKLMEKIFLKSAANW